MQQPQRLLIHRIREAPVLVELLQLQVPVAEIVPPEVIQLVGRLIVAMLLEVAIGRLRARIPTSYISSLLRPLSPNDNLANGFNVEQTEYINLSSDNGLRDAMSVMFENWP